MVCGSHLPLCMWSFTIYSFLTVKVLVNVNLFVYPVCFLGFWDIVQGGVWWRKKRKKKKKGKNNPFCFAMSEVFPGFFVLFCFVFVFGFFFWFVCLFTFFPPSWFIVSNSMLMSLVHFELFLQLVRDRVRFQPSWVLTSHFSVCMWAIFAFLQWITPDCSDCIR